MQQASDNAGAPTTRPADISWSNGMYVDGKANRGLVDGNVVIQSVDSDGSHDGAHGGLGGGRLVCLDFKTGKTVWDELGVQKGSVAFADGRLYYRTETGLVLLVEPSPEK